MKHHDEEEEVIPLEDLIVEMLLSVSYTGIVLALLVLFLNLMDKLLEGLCPIC